MDITYIVSFAIVGTEKNYKPRTKAVSIREGYSTFEDIRKILSIPLGLKPENIDVVVLTRASE